MGTRWQHRGHVVGFAGLLLVVSVGAPTYFPLLRPAPVEFVVGDLPTWLHVLALVLGAGLVALGGLVATIPAGPDERDWIPPDRKQ